MGNILMHLNTSDIDNALKKAIHFVEENKKLLFPSHYGDKKMNKDYIQLDESTLTSKVLRDQLEKLKTSLNKSTEENKKLKEEIVFLRKKVKDLEYDIEVMQL